MKKSQWLKERMKGLGGTDASAVLGKNPYMSNIDLWEYKTKRKKPDDISGKPHVQYGLKAEPHLIEMFKLDYPKYEVSYNSDPDDFSLIKHPKHKFLFASIDGQLVDKETGELGVLEVKTTNILQSMHREKWDGQVPQNYYIQVLHYLLCTGYGFAIIKAQLKSIWKDDGFEDVRLSTKHYFIKRSDVLSELEFLEKAEIKFWKENVLADKKPNFIFPEI